MATVVSFINYKGGVGKTTSTYHVGCSLAQHHKKRVLLVDIDPQTNLTFLCAPFEKWEKQKKKFGTIASIYERFQKKEALDVNRFIWKEPIKTESGRRISNLDILPCDIELLGEDIGGGSLSGSHFSTFEAVKRSSKAYLREKSFLRNTLREVQDKYDFILIDCPPNLYLMTQNALFASDWYVITAIPDHLSTIGLRILNKKVEIIGKRLKNTQGLAGESEKVHKVAAFGGVVFVKVRVGKDFICNTHEGKMSEVSKLLAKSYKKPCFRYFTNELIGYGEAAQNSVPVWEHSSDNARRATKKRQYQEITNEFLKRFGSNVKVIRRKKP